MTEQRTAEPTYLGYDAAYWCGRAEMAEAQYISGKPVPAALAELVHQNNVLRSFVERVAVGFDDKQSLEIQCEAADLLTELRGWGG